MSPTTIIGLLLSLVIIQASLMYGYYKEDKRVEAITKKIEYERCYGRKCPDSF